MEFDLEELLLEVYIQGLKDGRFLESELAHAEADHGRKLTVKELEDALKREWERSDIRERFKKDGTI